jgi:hypothetical protein
MAMDDVRPWRLGVTVLARLWLTCFVVDRLRPGWDYQLRMRRRRTAGGKAEGGAGPDLVRARTGRNESSGRQRRERRETDLRT